MNHGDLFQSWLLSHWQWWLPGLVLYLVLGLAMRYDRRKPETEEERKNME